MRGASGFRRSKLRRLLGDLDIRVPPLPVHFVDARVE